MSETICQYIKVEQRKGECTPIGTIIQCPKDDIGMRAAGYIRQPWHGTRKREVHDELFYFPKEKNTSNSEDDNDTSTIDYNTMS